MGNLTEVARRMECRRERWYGKAPRRERTARGRKHPGRRRPGYSGVWRIGVTIRCPPGARPARAATGKSSRLYLRAEPRRREHSSRSSGWRHGPSGKRCALARTSPGRPGATPAAGRSPSGRSSTAVFVLLPEKGSWMALRARCPHSPNYSSSLYRKVGKRRCIVLLRGRDVNRPGREHFRPAGRQSHATPGASPGLGKLP
jgi:hypothetical protein